MFTGRRYDSETGLYYYRFRYYDITLGRFLSADPLGYIDSMNLYAYCINNPVNFVDPMGLMFARGVDTSGIPLDIRMKASGLFGFLYDILSDAIKDIINNTPKGCVAIYDGNDSILGKQFEHAAELADAKINARNLEEAFIQICELEIERGCRFNNIYIYDHGNVDTHHQQLGDDYLSASDSYWGPLGNLIGNNGSIYLWGCTVGENLQYMRAIANASGRKIVAYTNLVWYSMSKHGRRKTSGHRVVVIPDR